VETTTEVGGTTTGGGATSGAGAQAATLANTGGAQKNGSTSLPVAGGLLVGLTALLAAAAIKRREILSKFVR
jgi:hypothetical protein